MASNLLALMLYRLEQRCVGAATLLNERIKAQGRDIDEFNDRPYEEQIPVLNYSLRRLLKDKGPRGVDAREALDDRLVDPHLWMIEVSRFVLPVIVELYVNESL